MSQLKSKRKIDSRFIPPVAGIDLVQALNYISLDDVGDRFIYDEYTCSHLPYMKGSRPALESFIARHMPVASDPMKIVAHLAAIVAEKVKWAGFYFLQTGSGLPANRAMTEEQLIDSGFGWCNEQARVFCCLTQICGIPSRLVFACNLRCRYGHVVTEVLLPSGWMLVDQSVNYLFISDNVPVQASSVSKDAAIREQFKATYKKAYREKLISQLPLDYLKINFAMAVVDNPLDGFENLGFCDHFCI